MRNWKNLFSSPLWPSSGFRLGLGFSRWVWRWWRVLRFFSIYFPYYFRVLSKKIYAASECGFCLFFEGFAMDTLFCVHWLCIVWEGCLSVYFWLTWIWSHFGKGAVVTLLYLFFFFLQYEIEQNSMQFVVDIENHNSGMTANDFGCKGRHVVARCVEL